MKEVLLINGHPDKQSFNHVLASAYKKGADKTNANFTQINISDLKFNPNLRFGYRERTPLEPDLENAVDKIKKATHIVWIYPMWWYGMPALLKGFIDRTFLPDIAFKSRIGKFPEKLLKGKSARIIITSDTPRWFDYIFMKSPAINQLKKGVLKFTGINPVKVTYISPLKNSKDNFRQNWLGKVEQLGLSDNKN